MGDLRPQRHDRLGLPHQVRQRQRAARVVPLRGGLEGSVRRIDRHPSEVAAIVGTQATWPEWVDSGEWTQIDDRAVPMLPALATEVMRLAMDPDVSVVR